MRKESERRRRRRIEREAGRIVQTMPAMPRSGDHTFLRLQRVAGWRAWVEQVRGQVSISSDLSNLPPKKMKDQMELNDLDPARAAETARALLTAGMGDIGVSLRADDAMRRQGMDGSISTRRLTQEYMDTWNDRGFEALVARRVGGETLCVGLRDALRINVWVSGEPGMPAVPLDKLSADA